MVVFGRPPGYRGSYKQWEEQGIPPQVVFEVLSPNNTDAEIDTKFLFYERYSVEEYYFIDPYTPEVIGFHRTTDRLIPIRRIIGGAISPRLGIRFEVHDGELKLFGPEGRKF